jgi:hypothetical protein
MSNAEQTAATSGRRANQLCFEFAREIERIEALLAA